MTVLLYSVCGPLQTLPESLAKYPGNGKNKLCSSGSMTVVIKLEYLYYLLSIDNREFLVFSIHLTALSVSSASCSLSEALHQALEFSCGDFSSFSILMR